MVFFSLSSFPQTTKHPLIARLKTPEIIHSKNMLFVHMPKIDRDDKSTTHSTWRRRHRGQEGMTAGYKFDTEK